jgi:hypothetical protein
MEGDRENWERFAIIRADGREGMSMYSRLLPGASVLIDRHYNSLKPYRKGESNMYAVARHGDCTVKYVEVAGQSSGSAASQPRLPGRSNGHGAGQEGP